VYEFLGSRTPVMLQSLHLYCWLPQTFLPFLMMLVEPQRWQVCVLIETIESIFAQPQNSNSYYTGNLFIIITKKTLSSSAQRQVASNKAIKAGAF
jgi:hypothetical protein